MSAFPFCRLLRSRWDNFARLVWPATLREQIQSERNRLDEELRRRQHRLLQCRQKIEKLRDYLHRCERRLQLLTSLAQDSTPVAELVGRRRHIDRLRQRMHECECAYDRLLIRFQGRNQRRVELRDQLVGSPLSRTAKNDEERSDLGYPF